MKRPIAVDQRWAPAETARQYRQSRWRSARAQERDVRLVADLLERSGSESSPGGILDVPCGAGRLAPLLESRGVGYIGVDVSPAMLAEAVGGDSRRRVRASAWRLPFRDSSFDVVVCCRLLHHVQEDRELEAVLAELVRVSSRLVIASFWDAGSLPHLRKKLGLRDAERDARVAIEKRALAKLIRRTGAVPCAWRHSLRYVSQQTFFAARKRG